MKKYKDDIKTILEVLSFIALYVMLALVDNPLIVVLCSVFWLLIWSWNIYDKLKYRRGGYPNEIRFPTQNSDFYKVSSLSWGGIILVGSLAWSCVMKDFNFIPIVGLLVGVLLLINGWIDVPKGLLKIENDKIKCSGIEDKIEISAIESIRMNSDHLIINKKQGQRIKLERLELDEKWTSKIHEFLKHKLDSSEIEIIFGDTK